MNMHWTTLLLKTSELARRRHELEKQMLDLDRQVDEFRRQVMAVAGQGAALKQQVADLDTARGPLRQPVSAEPGLPTPRRRFVFFDPASGTRSSIRSCRE